MKTDAELELLADQVVGLDRLPPDQGTKRFLELSGDLTGAELPRLQAICERKAKLHLCRATLQEMKRSTERKGE